MRVESRERWSVFRPQPAKCSTQSHHSLQGSKNPKPSAAQALIFRAAAIRHSNVHVLHIIKRMNAPPPTQTPQGQPCLTGVGNNPLTVTKHSQHAAVKDAEGTAQPLVLDSARWLCYLAKPQATPRRGQVQILPERMVLPSQRISRRSRSEISTAMLASNPRLNPSKTPAEAFLIQPLL